MTTATLKDLLDAKQASTITPEQNVALQAELDRRFRLEQDYVDRVIDR